MNTKCSKKILSTTAVATILLLFAFSVMCTPVSAATEAEIEQAIDDGMVWLSAQQNADGSWGDWDKVARTGFAVVKFATHATMADPQEDPFDPLYEYSDEVIDGLDYIFLNAKIIDINVEHGVDNPDTNGNGIGVYFTDECGWHQTYHTSIAMMAIAASADPDRVVNVPGSLVDGRTYQDVLQDIVDYMAWGQADLAPCRGGWDYTHSDDSGSWADNSNTGYAVLGLGYAQATPPHGLGCTVPDFVKTELNIWIDYIQNDVDGDADDGGSGYTGPDDGWVNILKTGNLLYEMGLYGDTESTQRVQDAIDYLCRHWNDPNQDPGWKGPPLHYQAMYTTMKGLEVFCIDEICDPPIDWFDDMSTAIVTTQNPGGSWPSDPWGDSMLATEWALLTLQKAVPPLKNQLPNVTGAYPSMDCLWPPNHKFVDLTIEGITDPDGDDVTITVTNITSDEPTASINGAGGAKYAPDADPGCIGTAIARVRAERSGDEDGRVYEITFLASDGIGEPVEGTVQVKVPHDQSGDCVSIDSGQNYDATAVN